MQGAIYNTIDVEIVHRRTEENIGRVLLALHDLDAVYRFQPYKKLRPNETHLRTVGHQLLVTTKGFLDVLGSLGPAQRDYEALLPESEEIDFDGARIRVLRLDAIIREKESAGRDKDKADLPLLKQTLNEIQGREDD